MCDSALNFTRSWPSYRCMSILEKYTPSLCDPRLLPLAKFGRRGGKIHRILRVTKIIRRLKVHNCWMSDIRSQTSRGHGRILKVHIRMSNVGYNHRWYFTSPGNSRMFAVCATLRRRVSHIQGHLQQRFFRMSTVTTVAPKLTQNEHNVRHNYDSQFLYKRNLIVTHFLSRVDRVRRRHPQDLSVCVNF